MIYLRYGIPRALRGLRARPGAALNSVLIVAASMSMLGMIALLYLNIQHMSQVWLSNSTISLFLRPGIGAAERASLLEAVRRHPMVRAAVEVTPQEGLRSLAEKLNTDHALLSGGDNGGLPYTIDVELFLDYRERLQPVARRLGGLPGVDEVVYAERMWSQANLFFKLTRSVGLIFIGLFLISFLLVVSRAVRLSLHARREEIEILDLVGATPGYIRSAFVVEGIIVSAAGYLLGLGLVWFSFRLVLAGVTWNEWSENLRTLSVFFPDEMLAAALLATMVLGGLSSRISVNRLLRELEG